MTRQQAIINQLKNLRKVKQLTTQDYIDNLNLGMNVTMTEKQTITFTRSIFSMFLSDLGFHKLKDAVDYEGNESPAAVFKSAMRSFLRYKCVDEDHHLYKQ